MAGKKWTKARKVAELRRRIGVPFQIRGITRRESFSTLKPLRDRGAAIPIYDIGPQYKMHSKQWVEYLHATIHAAVGRGIRRSNVNPSLDLMKGRFSPGNLPSIMVFTFGDTPHHRYGKNAFLQGRRIMRGFNPTLKFDVTFKPHRLQYEIASLHGQRKPTFRESATDGIFTHPGKYLPYQKKLFEVSLTMREAKQIVSRINRRLRAKGLPSLQKIAELFEEALIKKDKTAEEEAWRMAVKASSQKEWRTTQETTPLEPTSYLFYQEAARVLTNKFVKKSMNWLNKTLKEQKTST